MPKTEDDAVLAQAAAIREKRSNEEIARKIKAAQKIIGKCFRASNSYGYHSKRWMIYVLITGVGEHGWLEIAQFETDGYGDVAFRVETRDSMDSYKMIPREVYDKARGAAIGRAALISCGKAVKLQGRTD